jgi:regulator of sirC expression with transglutaminase-like and TPR domain
MAHMNFQPTTPSPLDYFATLVGSDHQFPLMEAAISVAQDEYPQLDLQAVLSEVDQLQSRLHRRWRGDPDPLRTLDVLNQFFFRDLGFAGNVNDYYDPDNSFIHAVLRTRRGIPISLAVLWLELASSVGLRVHGVGFPGHFLVKVMSAQVPGGQIVIDPFTGQVLDQETLLERLGPMRRTLSGMTDGQRQQAWLQRHLEPARPRHIIARMLRNLLEIYQAQGDEPRLRAVQKRLDVLGD